MVVHHDAILAVVLLYLPFSDAVLLNIAQPRAEAVKHPVKPLAARRDSGQRPALANLWVGGAHDVSHGGGRTSPYRCWAWLDCKCWWCWHSSCYLICNVLPKLVHQVVPWAVIAFFGEAYRAPRNLVLKSQPAIVAVKHSPAVD